MGYACPVCEEPQVDAKHLADHLALTALLGDDDHEAWLDEQAPGWTQADDAWLADRVLEHADTVDLPIDDEEHASAGGERFADDAHEPGVAFDGMDGEPRAETNPPLDEEAQAALREAYELTRARRDGADETDGSETE